jgi:transposase
VRRYLNLLRPGPGANQPHRPAPLSVRTVRRLILRRPDRLTDRDRVRLDQVASRCPTLTATIALAQEVARLLRQRRGRELTAWAEQAEASDIPELRVRARGAPRLGRRHRRLDPAMELPAGRGPGHPIKLLKRQMYGRANADLLRHRALLA